MDLLRTRRQLDLGKTIFDLPLKVVYYARVSTDRDEQLNSLENQIIYYDDYIKSNENWTFSGGYIDEGISGTSVDKRDNFLRMIKDANEQKFDMVITKEISRFSRSTLDSIKYTQELLDCGVGVYFQSDNINTLYTDAELRLTIMSSIAQDEMRRLSERVKFGMKRAYESGKILGQNNLYGYDKIDCKLVINEEEAKFVRDLFKMYAEDKYGYRTVARLLTEKGYRNQVGKDINPATLKNILINPKYKGYYHGRLTESNDYRRKKSIDLPEEDKLLYKDEGIPALVSEELWEKVNKIVKERTEKYKKQDSGIQHRYEYSCKIKCETHGTYHYRKVWKDRKVPAETWCCREYLAKGRNTCKTPHLYTRDLDSILEYIGEDILQNKQKYIKDIFRYLEICNNSSSNIYLGEVIKLNKEIEKNMLKKEKLLDLYTDGDMDKKEYLLSNTRLTETISNLNIKLENIKQEISMENNKLNYFEQTKKYFENISNENIKPIEIAQELLKEVVICKESTQYHIKIKIYMSYTDSVETVNIIKPVTLYGQTEHTPYNMTLDVKTEKRKYILDVEYVIS